MTSPERPFHPVAAGLYLCFLATVISGTSAQHTNVTVTVFSESYKVLPEFLSVTLDTYLMQQDVRWSTFDFRSRKVHTLLSGLSPGIVRVGGTPADFLVFGVPYSHLNSSDVTPGMVVMTGDDLDNLVNLTLSTGMKLLFEFNLQLRYGDKWDPTNAIQILEYCQAKGYGKNLLFELGNEPGLYRSPGQAVLTGTQIGKDYKTLRKILKSYDNLKDSLLVGPDVLTDPKILQDFVHQAYNDIDAVTFHHYYFAGQQPKANWTQFVDPRYFSNFTGIVNEVKSILPYPYYNMPVWVGETSDAYNSGAPNISDRFISGFLWLDKLGAAASLGVQVVMRQDFYGHYYGLINDRLDPNPDYWLSLLHKKLVGQRVLDVKYRTTDVAQEAGIRVYGHCTNRTAGYPEGAVTLFALNVNVAGSATLLVPKQLNETVDVYLLTPGQPGNLLSKSISLNGMVLRMLSDDILPQFNPVRQRSSEGISLPSFSYGFFVFPDTYKTSYFCRSY